MKNVMVGVGGCRLTVKSPVRPICPFTSTNALCVGPKRSSVIWLGGRPTVLFAVTTTWRRFGPAGVVVTFTLARWLQAAGSGVVCGQSACDETPVTSPWSRCAGTALSPTVMNTHGLVAEPVRWQIPTCFSGVLVRVAVSVIVGVSVMVAAVVAVAVVVAVGVA